MEGVGKCISKYVMGAQKAVQIEKSFTYHAPQSDQADRYVLIRETAKAFAQQLTTLCPETRELSLALRHLEEVVMWANASIARNE